MIDPSPLGLQEKEKKKRSTSSIVMSELNSARSGRDEAKSKAAWNCMCSDEGEEQGAKDVER